jgi:hypothetical protein
MKTKFFKYLMFIPLVCFVAACSDDDPAKEPLPEAFLEFKTATDAGLIFKGEAQEIVVELNVNRELEIEKGDASWVTTTPTVNDDNTVSLKIAVEQSDATKRRTATLTLTTKLAGETDKAATPLTIAIEQGVFGLVAADLLDLVFDAPGNGPNSARDISPMANPVYDMLPFSGLTPDCPKVFPTVNTDNPYGRGAAYFEGPNTCGKDGRRGSSAYRIDVVDYSTYERDYHGSDLASNTPFSLNPLGTAILKGSFSIEVIFKPEVNTNGDGKLVGFTQSWGGSIAVGAEADNKFNVNFYLDATDIAIGSSISDAKSVAFTTKPGAVIGDKDLLDYGKYYHVVGVFDKATGNQSIYLDGVKGTSERTFPANYVLKQADPKDGNRAALAQWIGIGGDARRSDPIVPNVHINSDYENWAEGIYKGEIVLVRMYGKALSDSEIKTLYDYELPEAE